MLLKLTAGDWSGDGHNITENRMYETNITGAAFEDALREAVSSLQLNTAFPHSQAGMGFLPFCLGYEDAEVGDEEDALKLGMVNLSDDSYGLEVNAWHEPDTNDWFEIHIRLVKSVLPDAVFEEVHPVHECRIGGYGLFVV